MIAEKFLWSLYCKCGYNIFWRRGLITSRLRRLRFLRYKNTLSFSVFSWLYDRSSCSKEFMREKEAGSVILCSKFPARLTFFNVALAPLEPPKDICFIALILFFERSRFCSFFISFSVLVGILSKRLYASNSSVKAGFKFFQTSLSILKFSWDC